jgi:hypothetical protein
MTARPKTATAVTKMAAQIKSGPVIDWQRTRRLHRSPVRKVRRDGGSIDCEHTQRQPGKGVRDDGSYGGLGRFKQGIILRRVGSPAEGEPPNIPQKQRIRRLVTAIRRILPRRVGSVASALCDIRI